MSLLPTCVVCDALLRGYNGDCLCDRCRQPCPTCQGDVAHCQHPLPVEATSCLADARKMVAERAEQLGKPYSELKRTGTGGWL